MSVTIIPAFATTDNVINFGWTIPRNTKHPERAMAMLNLMYSDPDVYNLLVFGIKDRHYIYLGNNIIDYPEGVTMYSSPYSFSAIGWEFGNQFQGYVQKGTSPTIWNDMERFNNTAIRSKALGFVFDATPVKTEVTACTKILDQYKRGLECGILDPEKYLPEFNAKLKAAGLDDIIKEKQRQLDAWASSNGIE